MAPLTHRVGTVVVLASHAGAVRPVLGPGCVTGKAPCGIAGGAFVTALYTLSVDSVVVGVGAAEAQTCPGGGLGPQFGGIACKAVCGAEAGKTRVMTFGTQRCVLVKISNDASTAVARKSSEVTGVARVAGGRGSTTSGALVVARRTCCCPCREVTGETKALHTA